jgi:hypothetical protein
MLRTGPPLLLWFSLYVVLAACAVLAPEPTAPKAAGTYDLMSIQGGPLPLAHRQEICPSTEQFAAGFVTAFDSVQAGFLQLGTKRRRLRPAGEPEVEAFDFVLVWRVVTSVPEEGRPARWDCYQGSGSWWVSPRGTIQLFSQFCVLVFCDPARREEIVASSPEFGSGTTLQITRFNGGVAGTFVKR